MDMDLRLLKAMIDQEVSWQSLQARWHMASNYKLGRDLITCYEAGDINGICRNRQLIYKACRSFDAFYLKAFNKRFF